MFRHSFWYTKNHENRLLLSQNLHYLDSVTNQACTRQDCEKVAFTRSQQEFMPILNYCKLFLSHSLVNYNNHHNSIFLFMIDMSSLFEKFVGGFIHKNFHKKDGQEVILQKSDLFLTEENRFQLRHDIYMSRDKNPFAVIDTKYKSTDFHNSDGKAGIAQSDMYQMLSYCVRRKCDRGILLYPAFYNDSKEKEISYGINDSFSNQRISIEAKKIDLIRLPMSRKEKQQYLFDAFKTVLQ